MTLRKDSTARLVIALGVLAGVIVPVLLLLTWGHTYATIYQSAASGVTTQRDLTFNGAQLTSSFRFDLICLSGAVVVLGGLAMIRPLRYRLITGLAAVAMAAQVAVLWREFANTKALPTSSLSIPNLATSYSQFSLVTFIVATVASGASLVLWLMISASTSRKVCPDCASRISRNEINCPHCEYEFPLPGDQKRCDSCRRPVKTQALVCRHCKHRFGAVLAETS